jgi:hypothetical protein
LRIYSAKWSGRRGSNSQLSAWESISAALYFQYLQNRLEKMYVHALHTVHALPDLRVSGGRLGDGVSDRPSLGTPSQDVLIDSIHSQSLKIDNFYEPSQTRKLPLGDLLSGVVRRSPRTGLALPVISFPDARRTFMVVVAVASGNRALKGLNFPSYAVVSSDLGRTFFALIGFDII